MSFLNTSTSSMAMSSGSEAPATMTLVDQRPANGATMARNPTDAMVSGMSMYPPIYREVEKRSVTRLGLDFLAAELQRPGTLVGIHPEGTRNKGDDPYDLLPAEQGFGRVVLSARPIVLPVFINGMANDFIHECRSTLDGSGMPIIMSFGPPVEFGEMLEADPQRLRAQVAIGRRVLEEIAALGSIERAERETLATSA